MPTPRDIRRPSLLDSVVASVRWNSRNRRNWRCSKLQHCRRRKRVQLLSSSNKQSRPAELSTLQFVYFFCVPWFTRKKKGQSKSASFQYNVLALFTHLTDLYRSILLSREPYIIFCGFLRIFAKRNRHSQLFLATFLPARITRASTGVSFVSSLMKTRWYLFLSISGIWDFHVRKFPSRFYP